MIDIIDGRVKLNHSLKKCDKLIRKAKSVSDASLLHFFDLIGLDPSLFKHLTEINIFIDKDEKSAYDDIYAFYENICEQNSKYDNSIRLLADYINLICEFNDFDVAFADLVRTIIHETIHANRSIIIDNGVLYPKSFLNKSKNYTKYSDKYFNLITDGNSVFNVLKITKLETYSKIVVYNRQTDCFEIYKLSNKYINNIKSTSDMEELINRRLDLFEFVKSIKNSSNINKTALISDYITTNPKMDDLSKKNMRNVSLEIEKQKGFEECLTECFARIIFYLKDKDEFNFDELLKSKDNTPDMILTYYFIKSLDMETIRWFFLSCYLDEYTNRFYELFKDNYFVLIDNINEAYECIMKGLPYPNLREDIKFIRTLKK